MRAGRLLANLRVGYPQQPRPKAAPDCITPCDVRQRGWVLQNRQGTCLGGCKVRAGRTRLTPSTIRSSSTRALSTRTAIALPELRTRASSTAPRWARARPTAACWAATRCRCRAISVGPAAGSGGSSVSSTHTSIVEPSEAFATPIAMAHTLAASLRRTGSMGGMDETASNPMQSDTAASRVDQLSLRCMLLTANVSDCRP